MAFASDVSNLSGTIFEAAVNKFYKGCQDVIDTWLSGLTEIKNCENPAWILENKTPENILLYDVKLAFYEINAQNTRNDSANFSKNEINFVIEKSFLNFLNFIPDQNIKESIFVCKEKFCNGVDLSFLAGC